MELGSATRLLDIEIKLKEFETKLKKNETSSKQNNQRKRKGRRWGLAKKEKGKKEREDGVATDPTQEAAEGEVDLEVLGLGK
ncbi:hypothetical protein C1H46_026624 [Malus baccata]|uniref:Uncharacterized protein n=1 Tax=Malus baccata TaxID=106549 RepID=A0A540LND3_MALBA|nr:hypothetical protein C1H46_026624 [Malus baccata]